MSASDDARRAANRERQRKYRERQRELKAKPDAVTRDARDGDGVTECPTTIRDSVESALGAMKWLETSDDAAIAQARSLGKLVDELEHAGETTKALSAHRALTAVLNDLGGTPTVRMQHELRALRAKGRTPEDPDGGSDEVAGEESSGRVSKFERPKKRRAS